MKQETKPGKLHLQLQIFQHSLLKAFQVLKQMKIIIELDSNPLRSRNHRMVAHKVHMWQELPGRFGDMKINLIVQINKEYNPFARLVKAYLQSLFRYDV